MDEAGNVIMLRLSPGPASKPENVRLTKLKLAGFKTFVDPTTIVMPGPLVGIVGPNGCGKSNVIDAVRWVLGEMRASALRGGSMQDVIFNGSTTRKPVQRASVELVFDNSQGRAQGAWSRYSEIAVKRVLDRSGNSSYHINNTQVRRKDVVDLFLGTGLGPRAYAIIEQGMISRLIEARPEDVRGFLEEAAGVTKYRERRKETEGRLSDARDNLARLDDIRNELVERTEHLRGQAEVALRYREMATTLEQRQQLLWLLRREQARAAQQKLETELAEATRTLESDNARLNELEGVIEKARQQFQDCSHSTQVAQEALFNASAETTRLESELRHLTENRRRIEARLQELNVEVAEWQAREEGGRSDLARWEELLENASMRLEQAEMRHEEVTARLADADSERAVSDTAVATAQRELSQTEQRLRVEETSRASAARALETLQSRRERLQSEQAAIVEPNEIALARAEAETAALAAQLEEAETQQHAAQAESPAARAALRQAIDVETRVRRTFTETQAHHNALVQLQNRVQSQGKLGDWLKTHDLHVHTPLWRDLDVTAGWEASIESALRERLSALTGDTVSAADVLLAQSPPESLALLLPQEASTHATPPAAPPGATPLNTLVRTKNTDIAHTLDAWLSGWFGVDAVGEWIHRRDTLAPGVHLVDRAGKVLTRDTLFHHAPDSRSSGVMERQREIEQTALRLEELEHEVDAAHAAVGECETHANALQTRIEETRRTVQQLQQQQHAAHVELLKLVQAGERALEQQQRVAQDFEEIERQETAERAIMQRAESELARQQALMALQQEGLDAALAVATERDHALRELRIAEQSAARDVQEAAFSQRECQARLDDTRRSLELATAQHARAANEIATNESELLATTPAHSEAALQEALELRNQREAALTTCRTAQEAAATHLREVEELRLATEHSAAPLRERIAEQRLAVQAANLSVEQFTDRLTEVKADIEALMSLLHADDVKEAALARDVARLTREINSLGAVNLAALDELSAAEARSNYLSEQYDDLMRAITTLEDAIRRIDRETREQLRQTYDAVNNHFGTIFPQLFGGGHAELVLEGEEILDAGVSIVAQPPGKKNSSIHLLSGGEKALTAIALVFSMFQLNPAPFCMLDEVDAPLDDANTERYCNMVRRMSSQTQFIFISHNKVTMEIAEQLVGVTMQEQGVSRIVEVNVEEALRMAEPVPA